MAFAKVILNGETLMDVTSDTVESSKLLSTYTATKNDGTKVMGSYVPPSPVISSLTVTPTETAQTFNATAVSGYKPVTVNAISSNYVGSAIPLRSAANLIVNGSHIYTPSGYYSSQVYANVSSTSLGDITVTVTSSTGAIDATLPYSAGYLTANGTKKSNKNLPTLSAQTITPTETAQYISSYRWLTGSQTIAAIPSDYVGSAIPLISSLSTISISREYASSVVRFVPETYSIGPGYLSTAVALDGQYYTVNLFSSSSITPAAASITLYGPKYLSQSLVIEAIPSRYIVPSGTYSITSNGTYDIGSYASVRVSCGGGKYYDVYKAVANNNLLGDAYVSGLSEWCDSLTSIEWQQFAGRAFTGSIYFNNVTSMNSFAFGSVFIEQEITRYNNRADLYFSRLTSLPWGTFAYNKNISNVYIPACSYIGGSCFLKCGCLKSISAPECTVISYRAFYSCSALSEVNFPKCISISGDAFRDCYSLTTANFPVCTDIFAGAFSNCVRLINISFPECTTISNYAFQYCSALTAVNFSVCETIGTGAFANCSSLSRAIFPECTSIPSYAFYNCSILNTIKFGNVVTIGSSAFANCSSLSDVLPMSYCTKVGGSAFRDCTALPEITLRNVQSIDPYAFYGCTSLSRVYINSCATIESNAFRNCYNLLSVYLTATSSVASLLATNAFSSTPISNYTTSTGGVYGSIYVPASLYNSYIVATNWSYFSSRIVSV